MANKGTTMNIILSCTISDDQLTAKVNNVTVEGNYSNPAATDPSDKQSKPIQSAHPAFDGTKTGTQIVEDCLIDFKKQIGTAP